MIQGIFYARFLPEKGTKIVAQSPPGCIVPVTATVTRQGTGGSASNSTELQRPGPSQAPGQAPSSASRNSPQQSGQRQQQQPRMKQPLFDFDVLQEYIIPKPAFFNRYVTATTPDGRYSVLGFPVCIVHPKYDRNEFIFNFGLVVEADVDQIPYERVVRRLAVTFAELEKQTEYLSRDDHRHRRSAAEGSGIVPLPRPQPSGSGANVSGAAASGCGEPERRPIESLLEIVKEDLNNYGECMIPVDDANTLNMKLFPFHPPPPVVEGWHVPVPKMRFGSGRSAYPRHHHDGLGGAGRLSSGPASGDAHHGHLHHHVVDQSRQNGAFDPTWDLTMSRVTAHIDGVSDVRRIAHLADVSLPLAKAAVQHLLYYDTVILLDMFFFGSCYAARPGIADFVANVDGIIDECAAYVGLGPAGVGVVDSGISGLAPSGLEPMGVGVGGGGASGSSRSSHREDHDHHVNRTHDHAHHHLARATGAGGGTGHYHYLLIRLMTTFVPGRTLFEWLRLHLDSGVDVLRLVDVRRLVQFGVIKGLLYRVHKYVVSRQYLVALATGRAPKLVLDGSDEEEEDDEGDEEPGGSDAGEEGEEGDVERDVWPPRRRRKIFAAKGGKDGDGADGPKSRARKSHRRSGSGASAGLSGDEIGGPFKSKHRSGTKGGSKGSAKGTEKGSTKSKGRDTAREDDHHHHHHRDHAAASSSSRPKPKSTSSRGSRKGDGDSSEETTTPATWKGSRRHQKAVRASDNRRARSSRSSDSSDSGSGSDEQQDIGEEDSGAEEDETRLTEDELLRYMDGRHHFDQIVTELNCSDARAVERFDRLTRGRGGMSIFYR